jgi:hypothetical protein
MDAKHLEMWTVVSSVAEVIDAIKMAPGWSEDARQFAAP